MRVFYVFKILYVFCKIWICPVNGQEEKIKEPTKIWQKGKPIPYEVSNQFSIFSEILSLDFVSFKVKFNWSSLFVFNLLDQTESLVIKDALVEIMHETCIKFVPRTKREPDYIVFMEYKALSQTRGYFIDNIEQYYTTVLHFFFQIRES